MTGPTEQPDTVGLSHWGCRILDAVSGPGSMRLPDVLAEFRDHVRKEQRAELADFNRERNLRALHERDTLLDEQQRRADRAAVKAERTEEPAAEEQPAPAPRPWESVPVLRQGDRVGIEDPATGLIYLGTYDVEPTDTVNAVVAPDPDPVAEMGARLSRFAAGFLDAVFGTEFWRDAALAAVHHADQQDAAPAAVHSDLCPCHRPAEGTRIEVNLHRLDADIDAVLAQLQRAQSSIRSTYRQT